MRALTATDALLLRAVDYRDADRILTLFTRELGVVSALARGAKGSRRRFSGVLEPYALLRVELETGRGDLYTLKRAELAQVWSGVLGDFDRIQAGAAALRLVRELCGPRSADPELFLALLQYLTLLDHLGDPARSALLLFAVQLLSRVGLGLGLTRCGRSGELVPPGRPAYFDPEVGAVVAARLGGGPVLLPGELRERLVRAQEGAWLDEARLPFGEGELAAARAALSAFIARHAPSDVGACLFPS
jgi:DNA repair protein RecO (recombination protein O)